MTAHSPAFHTSGRREDKRERILRAAEQVFARRGFFSARVAEIAREAGCADGTIYLYFKSKDDVLISLFESRMEELVGLLQATIEKETSAPGQLRALVRTYLALVEQQPALAEVLTVELRQSAKFMKEHSHAAFGRFLKLLARIVEAGQESGSFVRDISPQVAARAIFGAIDELALAWLLGGGEKFAIVRAGETVCSMLLGGLERKQV